MAKMKSEKHNIDGAFVLVLFAVFAVTIVAVLALGANSYKKLVERDEDSYNRRIITSYVTAKIRENDSMGALEVGGFTKADTPDGIDTLHMYQTIEGEVYDTRIYFYDNHICELLTLADIKINPDAGSPIMEANSSHKYDIADYSKIDSMFGNQEIFETLIKKAKKLGISVRTLKSHISSIYEKTGYNNLAKLAIYCVGNGLIVPNLENPNE